MQYPRTILRAVILTAWSLGLLTAHPVTAVAQAISITSASSSVPKYGKFEAAIAPFSTTATNPYWPYDTQRPANDITGVTVGVGITVNALFLPPGAGDWSSAKVQPCFWYQPMTPINGAPTPTGNACWMVRFAPDTVGTWQMKVQATDGNGLHESTVTAFTCTPSDNHGYLRTSPRDSRYFEFADGTPFVPGPGLHYDAGSLTDDYSIFSKFNGAFSLIRTWWQGSTGTMSIANLSGQGGRYEWNGDSAPDPNFSNVAPAGQLFSTQLNVSSGQTQASFKPAPGIPGHYYRFRALVETSGITGPAGTDPLIGAHYGPWLTLLGDPNQTITTQNVYPHGTTAWTWIQRDFNNVWQDGSFPYLQVQLKNCTGGKAYVARYSLQEIDSLGGNIVGPELAAFPTPDTQANYSQLAAYKADQELTAAAANNLYLKVVALEKQDVVFDGIGPDGTYVGAGNNDGSLVYGPGDKTVVDAQRWYQRAYLRYLAARYGWSPNIHSFEFINEGDPDNGSQWAGANHFADYLHAVNVRPMLATTSIWARQPDAWNTSDCDYVDMHRYLNADTQLGSTGDGTNNSDVLLPIIGLDGVSAPQDGPGFDNALVVSNPSVTEDNGLSLAPVPVTPGHTYRVHFAVRGTNINTVGSAYRGQGAGPWLGADFLDGHDAYRTGNLNPSYQNLDGTWGWQTRDTGTFVMPDGCMYLQINVSNGWASGTAYFSQLQLEDVTTGTYVPIANGRFNSLDSLLADTALLPILAWNTYTGGGGTVSRAFGKPWVLGETGLSGPQTQPDGYKGFHYSGEDQRVYDDLSGTWLHKSIWAGIAPGGAYPIWWWNEVILAYRLYGSATAFHTFMNGIPLSNGHYVDAQPACTGGLRAWGQVDHTAQWAHVWIDNPSDYWTNVVSGATIPAVSGTVRLSGFTPQALYTANWWDTRAGTIIRTETVSADSAGTIALGVTGLSTDVAVKITPQAPAPATILTATPGDGCVYLQWRPMGHLRIYQIKRATNLSGPYTVLRTCPGPLSVDTQVTNGTTYYYRIIAADVRRQNDVSNVASATPTGSGGPASTPRPGRPGFPHPPVAAPGRPRR